MDTMNAISSNGSIGWTTPNGGDYWISLWNLTEVRPHGISATNLIAFGGRISTDALRTMQDAIEKDCEAINFNGW